MDIDKIQPKNLAFLLHDQCNLKCSYCWERYDNKRWNKKLSFSEFTQIIDYFTENFWIYNKSEFLPEVKLGGGEAFIYADELMKMIDYILSLQNIIIPPAIILQTNGTCIPDAFFEKYKDKNISLGLSLDGPKDLQDEQRDNSFDKIPIKKILQYFPDTKIYITINKKNIYRIPEAVQFIDNLGFTKKQVTLNRYDECNKEELEFLHSLENNDYDLNFKQEKSYDIDSLEKILETIVVNPYGNFWICNHFPVSMPNNWGACGNYKQGIDIHEYRSIIQQFWNERKEVIKYDK